MFRVYLPHKFLLFPFALAFFLAYLHFWFLSLLFFFYVFTMAYLFRKRSKAYLDKLKNSEGVLLGPASGKVYSLYSRVSKKSGEERIFIRIILGPLNEYGLYLPFSSEVKSVEKYQGRPQFRYLDTISLGEAQKASIALESKAGEKVFLHLLRCLTGAMPSLWVEAGDRGRAGANFGYFPLGGSVVISLPTNCDVLVKKGQTVVANDTVIAAFK